jgi:hypothetical protein
MSEELIRFLKESKKNPDEDKLQILLGLTEKILTMVMAVESKNRRLEERVRKLEHLGKPAPTQPEIRPNQPMPPPPPPPPHIPTPAMQTKSAIMKELKELFKKRKGK